MEQNPLWTALITPMQPSGEVDFKSFEYMLRQQEEAGNGVLILGSTGEGLNLYEDEKREIVSFTKSLDLDVPMMVGIGGFQLSSQVDFIHFCNEVNPDALLLVTPLYAKPGAEGQFEWFSELMAETDLPCMLYNVPSRTGVKMHPSVPARISEEFDNLLGVKEASGSVQEFKAFREAAPEVDFYSGDDGLTPDFSAEGGVGLVSVCANVWPKATRKYVEMCVEGDTEELLPLWKKSTAVLFKAPNPLPVKVMAHRKGWIENDTVRLPLSLGDISEEVEKELLDTEAEITDWLENLN
ncbi:4-hydroxy-tetrahydrodipicolinate synthase [Gracilimonas mengyeensis]|uniref:4-hydroxy-tetrahydrodipicolinate synthase n=1 Tax=Gracilimonas mengyeensis TaxID=1302730 RepID=A0A521BC56_9BACT|nr:4-hydroxy-tetrahydrodipicolinate synthase [Gracilimonas mengyeensis]SMO44647.1 4-hydroxy-tetrahydrodipicolinate synthase [Gracilimonas mengyeensis]